MLNGSLCIDYTHHINSQVSRLTTQSSVRQPPTDTAPALYVLNASALTKPHSVEQLAADLASYMYDTDVAVVTETNFKSKHDDPVLSIHGYTLYHRDRTLINIYYYLLWRVKCNPATETVAGLDFTRDPPYKPSGFTLLTTQSSSCSGYAWPTHSSVIFIIHLVRSIPPTNCSH